MPTTGADGTIYPDPPALHKPPVQTITGSAVDAGAAKNAAATAAQASAAKSLGAGQHGSSRRRRRKMRGGVAPVNMNAQIPSLPEGGTIPGVSHAQNHLKAVDNLNQIRASAAGDQLINAQPKQHGGSSKKKRKTKRNGRHSKRNNRGSRSRRSTRRRRNSRVL
jgi:hypothetical protein